MEDYLIVCEHDEMLSVLKAESGIEKTIDDYILYSALSGNQGRIALIGLGEVGSVITDYLYEKLPKLEYMLDSFSLLDEYRSMDLVRKEGEGIYKAEPLKLVIIAGKIENSDHIDSIFEAIKLSKSFLCDEIYGFFIIDEDVEGCLIQDEWPEINITTVSEKSVCQKSETCTLLKIAPTGQLLLRLYIVALASIDEFLKKQQVSV